VIAQSLEAPMQIGAPDSIWGLAAVVAVQLLITASGAVHTWSAGRRQKTMRADMRDVRDNVVNGHGNLRGDIDRLIELGEDNQRLGEANATSVAELRGEVKGLTHRVDNLTPTTPILKAAPRTGW
jgi:hypothetical protein